MKVLQQLRKNLHERCGPPKVLPHIQLLYIETDPEAVAEALHGPPEAVLGDNEFVLAKLNKPSHYLKPLRGRPPIEPWMNMSMLCRVPRNQVTPEGLRILGRLAFADNYRAILSKVKSDLAACANPAALTAADRQTRLGVRTSRPRVYIVTSLGGGTGSGMFIDLAYAVRRQLKQLGVTDVEVVGLFLLPAADRNARKNPALVNAFAALTELNHFTSPQTSFTATFDEAEEAFHDPEAPFSRCFMLPLPEISKDREPTAAVLAWAGDFLCRDLVTPLGRSLDEARAKLPPSGEAGMVFQTFAAYLFSTPRRALLDRAGRLLTQQLLQGWLTAERALNRAVRAKLADLVSRLERNAEGLITALQTACERCLGQEPETVFHAIIHETFGGPAPDLEQVPQVLAQLEQIVGQPQEEGSPVPPPTPLMTALDEAARTMRREWESKFSDLVHSLMEDPKFRLVGAEEAGSQLLALMEEVVEQHQPLLNELLNRAGESYLAIDSLVKNLRKGSWWPGRTTKMAHELREALEVFPKARYQSLILESLLEVYQELIKRLPKRLEDLGFCRQRLTDLLKSLNTTAGTGKPSGKLGPGRHFLPGDCLSVEDAVKTLLDELPPDTLQELDHNVQAMIRRQFKSLLAVCLASNEVFAEFQAALRQQAEAQLEAILGKASVAAVYLERHTDEQEIAADLSSAFDSAMPTLAGPRSSSPELRFLVVPNDAAGEQLGELARSVMPGVEVVTAEGASDIYFYRERSQVPLAELPQLGLMAEEVYKQMTAAGHFTPHTRTDVTEWLPAS